MSSVRHSGPPPQDAGAVDALITHLVDEGNRFLTLSVDLLVIADLDHRVTWVNPACEQILGYTREELVGRRYLELVHPDDVEMTRRVADSIPATGDGLAGFENRYRAKDGSYRWLLWSATPDLQAGLIYAVAKDVTDRKETEAMLQRREAQLAEAQQMAHLGSWVWDIAGSRLEWSEELYRIYGLDSSDSPDLKTYLERVHPEDRELVRSIVAAAVRDRRGFSLKERIVRPDGDVRTLLTTGRIVLSDDGEPVRILGTSQDVTESERAKAAIAEAEERFRNAFDNAPTGMGLVSVDPETVGELLRVNDALCKIVGYSAEELVGRDIQAIAHPEDVDADVHLLRRLLRGEIANYEMEKRYIHADGHVLWALVRGSIVRDLAGKPLYGVGQLQDVTERKRFEEQLAHQALHDPLTGLPNRTLALDRLEQALARAARSGSTVAVLFIDIDHFKVVNDSLGHHVGDSLLIAVAHRLRKVLRATDTVARFGGDEYVMICDELPSSQEATRMTERVEAALARPVELEGEDQVVTASIGVAVAEPRQEHDAEALIRDADAAMYRAKDLGRARSETFDQDLRSRAVARLSIERALRRALREDELRIHYQPIVSLRTGRIVDVEALLRWERPDEGLVSPADFLSVAEETGQIVSLGTWVLREVCRTAASWRRTWGERAALPVYVNIAGRQLTAELPDLIAQILLDSDLSPAHLGVEITESGLMEHVRPPADVLEKLQGLGIRILLDDFGTGYSSLSHLARLPIDGFKIDRSFVSNIGGGAGDSAIVSTVAAMGKALGLTVVAEGVETAEHEEAVRMLGCDFAQGYHFARPMPREEIEATFGEPMTERGEAPPKGDGDLP